MELREGERGEGTDLRSNWGVFGGCRRMLQPCRGVRLGAGGLGAGGQDLGDLCTGVGARRGKGCRGEDSLEGGRGSE